MATKSKWSKYVHEYYFTKRKRPIYVVAEYNPESDMYVCPLSQKEIDLTGCYAEFSKNLKLLGNRYQNRRSALRRARYLFGGK